MSRSLFPLLFLLSGCTAVRASYFLVDAERKYQSAVNEGADERAPYEITMARELLWKAREETNNSDYGAAEQLCKKSVTFSASAYERSVDGPDLQNTEDFVPELREEKPVEERNEALDDINLDDL